MRLLGHSVPRKGVVAANEMSKQLRNARIMQAERKKARKRVTVAHTLLCRCTKASALGHLHSPGGARRKRRDFPEPPRANRSQSESKCFSGKTQLLNSGWVWRVDPNWARNGSFEREERCHKKPWLRQFWRDSRVEKWNRDEPAHPDLLGKIGLYILLPIFPYPLVEQTTTEFLTNMRVDPAQLAFSTSRHDIESQLYFFVFLNCVHIHIGMVGHETQLWLS